MRHNICQLFVPLTLATLFALPAAALETEIRLFPVAVKGQVADGLEILHIVGRRTAAHGNGSIAVHGSGDATGFVEALWVKHGSEALKVFIFGGEPSPTSTAQCRRPCLGTCPGIDCSGTAFSNATSFRNLLLTKTAQGLPDLYYSGRLDGDSPSDGWGAYRSIGWSESGSAIDVVYHQKILGPGDICPSDSAKIVSYVDRVVVGGPPSALRVIIRAQCHAELGRIRWAPFELFEFDGQASVTPLAAAGRPVTGENGEFFSAELAPVINNAGIIAALSSGYCESPPCTVFDPRQSLFLIQPNGAWTQHLRTHDAAPGLSIDDTIYKFVRLTINDAGHVAVLAAINSNGSVLGHHGIWTNRSGAWELLVQSGDPLPWLDDRVVTQPVDTLGNSGAETGVFLLTHDSDIIFSAQLDGDTVNGPAILRSPPDGSIEKLFESGDAVPGMAGFNFDSFGEMALLPYQADGAAAVFTSRVGNGGFASKTLFKLGLDFATYEVLFTEGEALDEFGVPFDQSVRPLLHDSIGNGMDGRATAYTSNMITMNLDNSLYEVRQVEVEVDPPVDPPLSYASVGPLTLRFVGAREEFNIDIRDVEDCDVTATATPSRVTTRGMSSTSQESEPVIGIDGASTPEGAATRTDHSYSFTVFVKSAPILDTTWYTSIEVVWDGVPGSGTADCNYSGSLTVEVELQDESNYVKAGSKVNEDGTGGTVRNCNGNCAGAGGHNILGALLLAQVLAYRRRKLFRGSPTL